MKINKMTASFGKLENESIAFHDGLNVVCKRERQIDMVRVHKIHALRR